MPKYIIHIDGDAFFASVETAKKPWLKGKSVVVGGERGIASAMSYEAKARGVVRGMPIFQIRKLCPDVIVLSSDYDSYVMYSKRMMNIVRRYTHEVEEYSIDECFADITNPINKTLSYEDIVKNIAKDIEKELSLTVSIGLASTKVLAKIASKRNKPKGITILNEELREEFLKTTSIGNVWMIGSKTSAKLVGHGVLSAFDFAIKPLHWVRLYRNRPIEEIWRELGGESVYGVVSEDSDDQKSISRTRTFHPKTGDHKILLTELSKNLENACIKARNSKLKAKKISIFIKTEFFTYKGGEFELDFPDNIPNRIMSKIEKLFWSIYDKKLVYRATGVKLFSIVPTDQVQNDLFGNSDELDKENKIFECVDSLDNKYGRHTVSLLSSLNIYKFNKEDKFKFDMQKLRLIYLGEVN